MTLKAIGDANGWYICEPGGNRRGRVFQIARYRRLTFRRKEDAERAIQCWKDNGIESVADTDDFTTEELVRIACRDLAW